MTTTQYNKKERTKGRRITTKSRTKNPGTMKEVKIPELTTLEQQKSSSKPEQHKKMQT